MKSQNLWERRISIISTFHFIRNYDFDDTLKIAEILLNDKEDLIHKAVGWMLWEVWKRELEIEEEFLQEHYQEMPRTMLRYAIERIKESRRKMYLKGQIWTQKHINLKEWLMIWQSHNPPVIPGWA